MNVSVSEANILLWSLISVLLMVSQEIAVISSYLNSQDDLRVKTTSKTHPESPSPFVVGLRSLRGLGVPGYLQPARRAWGCLREAKFPQVSLNFSGQILSSCSLSSAHVRQSLVNLQGLWILLLFPHTAAALSYDSEHIASIPGIWETFLDSCETGVSYEQKYREVTRVKIIWKDATADVAETTVIICTTTIRQYLNLVALARRWQIAFVLKTPQKLLTSFSWDSL